MKLASILGRYEDEWNEGDWKLYGEVPAMIKLWSNVSESSGLHEHEGTYSSRMKLPTERPPQLIPAMRLPAWLVLSRRPRSRMEMGRE
jgi:hypothetical protein